MVDPTTDQKLAYRLESTKPFKTVVESLERLAPEHQFRVLAVHDVQKTLAEKGFERGPLTIVEVCNASNAHKALQMDINVALFLPCRFAVYTEGNKTVVALSRPTLIADMLPEAGLEELAGQVEEMLKKVMQAAV
ncbi:MAG: DUF302 domain-containing protein [Candidatus Zixiibacteriota bacterium]